MSRPGAVQPAEAGVFASLPRRQLTIALMLATAMQAFDATIVNVALPRLEASFGGGIALGSWVITSYLCAAAVSAPLTGWLRRRYGARRLIAGAISLFVFASLVCSLAPSAGMIVLFRLLQGGAAGIIQPLAQATLLDIYPKRDHGRMLALWGATIMTGPVLGPALGGIITDLSSWRWIFAINLPLGMLAAAGLRRLPTANEGPREAGIDLSGIILISIGIGALQLALERSIGHDPLKSPEIVGEAIIAMVALFWVPFRSSRANFSFLKLEIFKDINLSLSNFYTFVVAGLLFSTIVLVPALSEGPLGTDATVAGLILSPRGVMTLLTMLALTRVISKIDHRVFLLIGLATTAAALELFARAPEQGAVLWLAGANAILGVGVGLLFTPLSTLAFSTLGAGLRTDGAGVYSLLRQLGSAAGVAILVGVLQARISTNVTALAVRGSRLRGAGVHLMHAAVLAGYADCFRFMAIAALALIPGVILFRVPRRPEETADAA